MFEFLKKIKKVWGHEDLAVCFVALEALRECFGQDVSFRHLTDQRKGRGMRHEVETFVRVPWKATRSKMSQTFHARLTFTLEEIGADLSPDGPIKISILEGGTWSDPITLSKVNGTYVMFRDSTTALLEFKKKRNLCMTA